MPDLTPEAHQRLAAAAQRNGFSPEAALTVFHALSASGGTMAQFNHPELGGMGQWSQRGMVMVGDMFNHGLKRRVDTLCSELAGHLQTQPAGSAASSPPNQWWPAELGTPGSSGSQNGLRYAYFPAARRLAIQQNGRLELYDTGNHHITGVSQQQSGEMQLPSFSSDKGLVRLADLKPAGAGNPATTERAASAMQSQPAPGQDAAPSGPTLNDPLATLERLAELHQKGVLTEDEFTAKKAELLGQL